MKDVISFVVSLPKRAAAGLIKIYQRYISPHTQPTCRFIPTCSQYALTAIQRYGLIKGGWMGCRRILRCNPWSKGGYDPVP